MYNEDRKIWFLSEDNTERDYKTFFDKTEKYEILYEEDACDWSISQILGFYKRESSRSLYTIRNMHYALNSYSEFCVNNNLTKNYQNNYKNITKEMLMSCINTGMMKNTIISREELTEKLNELNNPSDKFIILALFEGIRGIKGDDILNARTTQIDGNVIHLHSGKSIAISDELKSYAFASADEWLYSSETEFNRNVKLTGDPDEIVKRKANSRSEKIYQDYLPARVRNIANKHGWKCMTPKTIYDSGKLHFIKERLKKHNVSLKEYVSDPELSKELIEKYGNIRTTTDYINEYSEYLK